MSDKGRDPQFRVFRRTLQGVHFAVAGIFGVLLAVGAWRGVGEIRPERPVLPASSAECVEKAQSLRDELVQRLSRLPAADSAAEEGRAFEDWSVGYRGRLNDAKARCKNPEGASPATRAALREAFGTITRSLDLSAITATHWARHLGPSLDESAEAIRAARNAP